VDERTRSKEEAVKKAGEAEQSIYCTAVHKSGNNTPELKRSRWEVCQSTTIKGQAMMVSV